MNLLERGTNRPISPDLDTTPTPAQVEETGAQITTPDFTATPPANPLPETPPTNPPTGNLTNDSPAAEVLRSSLHAFLLLQSTFLTNPDWSNLESFLNNWSATVRVELSDPPSKTPRPPDSTFRQGKQIEYAARLPMTPQIDNTPSMTGSPRHYEKITLQTQNASSRSMSLKRASQTSPASSPQQVFQHFSQSLAPITINENDQPNWIPPPKPPHQQSLLDSEITPEEVARQLKRLPNRSAPGPDGVTYHWLRNIDPNGQTLALLFNICLHNKRIPASWKASKTILIHKANKDPLLMSSWRPISLQQSTYKLYAAILAHRAATWAISTKALSPSQKGFLPGEGIFEHSFALKSALHDARTQKRPISIAYVDFANAFGSLPHHLIIQRLYAHGMSLRFVDIINDIYTGSTTAITLQSGPTQPIPVRNGVLQGCPLSPSSSTSP